jgi:hypothetical protein
MESGDLSQLTIKGAPLVEGDVKGFLDASYTFKKIVVDMETNLIASCGGRRRRDQRLHWGCLRSRNAEGERSSLGPKVGLHGVACPVSGIAKVTSDGSAVNWVAQPAYSFTAFGDMGEVRMWLAHLVEQHRAGKI